MRYEKGTSTVTTNEILSILEEEGIASANTIATRLGRHYKTITTKLEQLIEEKKINKIQYSTEKRNMRLYELRVDNEPEQTTKQTE